MNERLLMAASWTLHRLFFKRSPLPSNPRALLYIQLDHIGDALLAEPALASLRAHYPRARLDVLCARWNRAVFENSPHVQRILEFNPRAFRRDGRPPDSALKTWRAFKALRGEYALTMCVRGSWTALALANGCWFDRGADRLEMKRRRQQPPDHAADAALQMLASRGMPIESRPPRFYFTQEQDASAARLLKGMLKKIGGEKRQPVALHVGSPVRAKRWPTAKFASLAERLYERGMAPLLVGARGEAQLTAETANTARVPTIDLSGQTTLGELGALLSRCAGFVGNDSAPMHIAAAVGLPAVGLFFASDPRRFGPRGERAGCLQAPSPHALDADAALNALLRLMNPS